MTTVAAILDEQRDELFDAAGRELRAEMGSVSIVKFLDARDEQEAKENWFGVIARFLDALPPRVFVGAAASAGSRCSSLPQAWS